MRLRFAFAVALAVAAPAASRADIPAPRPPKPVRQPSAPPAPRYPATRADDAVDTMFGVPVRDPYRWLEDATKDEVKAWMAAEDKLARDKLAALPGRDALTARLKQLYYVDSISAPYRRGTRFFYRRTHADKEKAIIYWREGEDGAEQVLLDPNKMSADGSTSLGTWNPSWDGKRVAYALKVNNSDEATFHVMEVATGAVSSVDVIDGAKYGHPVWTPSGDGFYYVKLPVDPRIPVAERPGHADIRFHRIGEDPKNDAIIKEKTGNPKQFLGVDLSRDGHWLFYTVQHGWNATDVYFRDARKKAIAWTPLATGKPFLYQVEAWKDRFYIHTNEDAPRYRVFAADPKRSQRKDWKLLVAEDKDAVLEHATVIGGHLALGYLKNASSLLELRTLDGKPVRKIALPSIGAVGGFAGLPEDDTAYYDFNSFLRPTEIHKISIKAGSDAVWAQVKLPIDPGPYVIDQVFYPSKDGTRISMFLVHKKDLARDGTTPFILYGYGGFNINLLPSFNSGLFPWLEAGGGYAVPNLRGGGEYGEEWHKGGMLHKKQNVFDDYIGAAEYLIKNKYTNSNKLAIRGGSNGGLLVGAAMTQRPDLYRAVICAVPLLDMLRYHLFGSGKTWVEEYGSADDKADFEALSGYSPYHHVKAGTKYPALLMMSADSDDRVDPMHARKMTAAIQAANPDGHDALLRIEKHAGHGGADLVKQMVEQSADAYAFLMSELGLAPTK